jgi:hypothetical protein
MATALDAVSSTPGPYVLAIGWAFRCGTTSLRTAMGARPARLDVLVDGLPIHAYFVTGVREDVRAAFVSYCGPEGVPADPGVYVFVDMSAYPLGRHYLSLRLSDDVSGAVVYSDTRPVDR